MRTQVNSSQKIEKTRTALIHLTNKHPEAMVELVHQNYVCSSLQQIALSPTYYATIDAHMLAKYTESGRMDRKAARTVIEAVVKQCPLTKSARKLLKQLTLHSLDTILTQFHRKHRAMIGRITRDRQLKTRKRGG